MDRSQRRRMRVVMLSLVPVALALVTTGAVRAGYETPPPEQQTGTPGAHFLRDTEADPSVNCVYQASPPPPLKTFKVRAPRVSWPNLHPGNQHESGKVSWRVLVQKQTSDVLHTWKTVKTLATQRLTAHEGSVAGFSRRTIPWDKPGTNWYRLVTVLTWKDGAGMVVGTVRHWVQWYAWVGASPATTSGGCVTEIH